MHTLELSQAPLPKQARILFMGTPDFAVLALRALAQWCEHQGAKLVGVVSCTDRPKGRGNYKEHQLQLLLTN